MVLMLRRYWKSPILKTHQFIQKLTAGETYQEGRSELDIRNPLPLSSLFSWQVSLLDMTGISDLSCPHTSWTSPAGHTETDWQLLADSHNLITFHLYMPLSSYDLNTSWIMINQILIFYRKFQNTLTHHRTLQYGTVILSNVSFLPIKNFTGKLPTCIYYQWLFNKALSFYP